MSASKVAGAWVLALASGCSTTVNIYQDSHEDAAHEGAAAQDAGSLRDATTLRCAAGDALSPALLSALGIDPLLPLAPKATTQVSVAVNLDVRASLPMQAWDVNNPATSSNFSSSLTGYDSLGNGHQLITYFTRTSSTTWDWHTVADGAEIVGGGRGVPFEGASGTLRFTTDGALKGESTNASTWNFPGAAAGQYIQFDFGRSLDEAGTGLDGTTNFADLSITHASFQDGHAAGSLFEANVDAMGNIVGSYTNGERLSLGHCP